MKMKKIISLNMFATPTKSCDKNPQTHHVGEDVGDERV